MTTSESINEIAGALAKAQGDMKSAAKDSTNPHFKSKYADLASCWEACREPLAKNGLSVVQGASAEAERVTVTTLLLHTSGQWVRDALTTTARDAGAQSIGSAITYGRRYGLSSMVGIAPDEDDAEAAQGRGNGKAAAATAAVLAMPPAGYADWLIDMEAVTDEGIIAFRAAFKNSKREYLDILTKDKARLDAMVAAAYTATELMKTDPVPA